FPPVGQRPWSQRSPGGHIRWKGPEGGTATPPRAQGTRTWKGAVPRRVSRGPQLKRPRVPRQMAIPRAHSGTRHPAIHVEGLPDHVAGLSRGQEDVRRRAFGRLSGAAQGGALAELRELVLGLAMAGLERRPDGARGHRVHADSARGELLGETLG